MISIRAVLLGLAAVAVAAPAVAAEVNIIYPPKRAAAYDEEAPPVEQKRANINQVVNVIVVKNRRRESRGEIVQRALFRNWTGFDQEYSGPKYPF